MREEIIHPGKLAMFVRSLKERRLLARLVRSLKTRGLKKTFAASLTLREYYFDFLYGTDTMTWVDRDEMGIDDAARQHAVLYQPSTSIPVRKILTSLNIPPGSVFVDLGCGKGLILFIASTLGFREVRGIEISPLLCAIARKNCELFRRKKKPAAEITVIESNVLDYAMRDDEDVFYMFNPFDAHVLERMMRNIDASIARRNRRVVIIYNNAKYRECIVNVLRPTETKVFMIGVQEFVVYTIERDEKKH